jgi:uncharacterized membrane protein YadS
VANWQLDLWELGDRRRWRRWSGLTRRTWRARIGLTAVIGVLLVLGLPLLIAPFLLSNLPGTACWPGWSVYAVPQVVASGVPGE